MERYSLVARTLHWIMAILILFNLWLGLGHDSLPRDWQVMPVHKSVGLTVLVLALLRLIWRLTHRPTPLPGGLPAGESAAAKLTHYIFYAFMLLVPLSGWIMTSAGNRPLNWFFLFDVPKFAVSKGDAIVGISSEVHELLGYAWIALLVLHVGAALRHHIILKDDVLRRMLG
ncbi:cytochrome b [Sphingobium bisphenolivorans]|uniref:cytochrome b n=1 Tax=Sphingobium bisphenolivorans TaxID=1335760 RepID=UPI000482D461|nr:cytochrome b [Sphingobium bisphenolivorans]